MATTILTFKRHYPLIIVPALILVAVIVGDRLPMRAIIGILALVGIGCELYFIRKLKQEEESDRGGASGPMESFWDDAAVKAMAMGELEREAWLSAQPSEIAANIRAVIARKQA